MSEVEKRDPLEPLPSDSSYGRYVIFHLAQTCFGIAIRNVREVMEMPEITSVPNSPASFAGLINHRGNVVPVIDLRQALKLAGEPVPTACIMIVRIRLGLEEEVLGVMVDEVLEVITLQPADLLLPEELTRVSRSAGFDMGPCLTGGTQACGQLKLLLDIDQVLNNLDMNSRELLALAA